MIARRGEIKEFSDMYNHTRHLALERLEAEAAERGCNAVVDIITRILPFGPGVREMLMVGTGSYNPAFGQPKPPFTSELTGEELWNLTQLGYAPLRLVLGTSVYALGLAGGIGAFFRSFARGEIDAVTRLVYDARENCLDHIRLEAEELRADGVIGIKVFIYELGGGWSRSWRSARRSASTRASPPTATSSSPRRSSAIATRSSIAAVSPARPSQEPGPDVRCSVARSVRTEPQKARRAQRNQGTQEALAARLRSGAVRETRAEQSVLDGLMARVLQQLHTLAGTTNGCRYWRVSSESASGSAMNDSLIG